MEIKMKIRPAALETLHCWKIALPFPWRSFIIIAVTAPSFSFMSTAHTWAPSFANNNAASLPIPPAAPVIIATFPVVIKKREKD